MERLLTCAMDIGEQLLISGAEVHRVEESIQRMCNAFGFSRTDVFIITSSMVVTAYTHDNTPYTQTRRITTATIDIERIHRLNALSRKICSTKMTEEEIRKDLAFMPYAPILFISAKTGQRVDRLFELIDYVSNQAATRITTGMLNNVLADAQTRVQPPTDKGRRLKIYYMTQVGVRPPHFVIFCNDSRLFHFSYQRYIENCIRNTFGLEGTPIILSIRQKGEKEE